MCRAAAVVKRAIFDESMNVAPVWCCPGLLSGSPSSFRLRSMDSKDNYGQGRQTNKDKISPLREATTDV